MILLPHQQRVVEERDQYVERLTKLHVFIDGPMFEGLPLEDQELMGRQSALMDGLVKTLDARIARFK